jgi:hypothetical protein
MFTVRRPVPIMLKVASRLTKEERLPDEPIRFADVRIKFESPIAPASPICESCWFTVSDIQEGLEPPVVFPSRKVDSVCDKPSEPMGLMVTPLKLKVVKSKNAEVE